MTTTTYTVQPNTTVATQIVFAGGGPVLITNTDLTGTIYISESSSAKPGDETGIVPLGPNASISLDGKTDFYAVTNNATPIVVASIAGGFAIFQGLTEGMGTLVIPNVRSQNYVPGVSGWAIFADGSAEFNDVTIRGATLSATLTAGNTVIINQDGMFFYDGPARGVTPPTNAGGSGGTQTSNIPNTATASVSGGESGQQWTKVSDDGTSTAVFRGIA